MRTAAWCLFVLGVYHLVSLEWTRRDAVASSPPTKPPSTKPPPRRRRRLAPPPLAVDPFIGTAGTGHTTPGAKYPFGMIYLAPMSRRTADWTHTAGYQHRDRTFVGLAHTAVSGTGIRLGLDFVVSPCDASTRIVSERASPGYYRVETSDVRAEFAAGNRYGAHRYASLRNASVALCFDDAVAVSADRGCVVRAQRKAATIWATYRIYMHARSASACRASGPTRVDFDATHVDLAVAISYVDPEGAERNFDAERAPFARVRARATRAWRHVFQKTQRAFPRARAFEGSVVFQTAVYHMATSPHAHNDVDGRFLAPDGRIHRTPRTFYTFLSTWDVYRTWGPLMCRMHPDVMRDVVHTALLHYNITGVFPRWTYAGKETNCMPSMHSITLVYQAVVHNLTTAAENREIYRAFCGVAAGTSTFTTTRRVNAELVTIITHDGILPADGPDTQTVSQMLEYAVVWACISKMAARFNDSATVARFDRYARVYQRLYDPQRRMYTGLTKAGARVFDDRPTHASNTNLFTEGSAMQWIFHVMHDLPGLFALMGNETVERYLDTIFTQEGTSEVPDVTGLIGMYAHGNEPSHHVVFLYFMVRRAETARRYIERIQAMYTEADDGLCGNDDAGQMSAWYVATKLGVYPLDPTSPDMLRF